MSLGGPALGMAVDVFDDDGQPVRGAVGELVCTKPWPGMTRGLCKDPERYLETYWSRWPDVWVHGDWASIDGRPVVPARPQRRHDQGGRQAARSGRGRVGARVASRGRRGRGGRRARRASRARRSGRSWCSRPGVEPRTSCAPSCATWSPTTWASRSGRARSASRRRSQDAQRQGAAAGHPRRCAGCGSRRPVRRWRIRRRSRRCADAHD